MKTFIALVIVAGGLIFAGLAISATDGVEPETNGLTQSIVRLTFEGKTFCSGSVITDTTIVTAAHCVMSQSIFGDAVTSLPINIRQNSNADLNIIATLYYVDPKLDRALLKGDFKKLPKIKYLSSIAELSKLRVSGKHMISCGYPLSGDLYCSNVTYLSLYNFMWLVHGLLLPGMSGGPTMTPEGIVIAINTAVEGDNSIVSPLYNVDFNLQPPVK